MGGERAGVKERGVEERGKEQERWEAGRASRAAHLRDQLRACCGQRRLDRLRLGRGLLVYHLLVLLPLRRLGRPFVHHCDDVACKGCGTA